MGAGAKRIRTGRFVSTKPFAWKRKLLFLFRVLHGLSRDHAMFESESDGIAIRFQAVAR